jgi:hypothetical protein
MDLFHQNDYCGELFLEAIRLVVLVPLLKCETFFLVLWKCRVRQQNRPFVYRMELVEVLVEKDDRDPIKILPRLSKIVELFVYSI